MKVWVMHLNMWEMWIIAFLKGLLVTFAVMRSKPGTLFSEYFLMTYFISLEVNGLTGRESGKGEFRYVLTMFVFTLSNLEKNKSYIS